MLEKDPEKRIRMHEIMTNRWLFPRNKEDPVFGSNHNSKRSITHLHITSDDKNDSITELNNSGSCDSQEKRKGSKGERKKLNQTMYISKRQVSNEMVIQSIFQMSGLEYKH